MKREGEGRGEGGGRGGVNTYVGPHSAGVNCTVQHTYSYAEEHLACIQFTDHSQTVILRYIISSLATQEHPKTKAFLIDLPIHERQS
jgi:hypothetical protein